MLPLQSQKKKIFHSNNTQAMSNPNSELFDHFLDQNCARIKKELLQFDADLRQRYIEATFESGDENYNTSEVADKIVEIATREFSELSGECYTILRNNLESLKLIRQLEADPPQQQQKQSLNDDDKQQHHDYSEMMQMIISRDLNPPCLMEIMEQFEILSGQPTTRAVYDGLDEAGPNNSDVTKQDEDQPKFEDDDDK